ncbi:unnamed protein product [Schistosoma mattheei]|uniref:Uncharacterized protein n=1 Tax=Schistosoma mattheei TaxID=31246 RepID=A0A183PRE0_9TREM|nr:unnamed protein product [Schistosoma mattheei]
MTLYIFSEVEHLIQSIQLLPLLHQYYHRHHHQNNPVHQPRLQEIRLESDKSQTGHYFQMDSLPRYHQQILQQVSYGRHGKILLILAGVQTKIR